MVVLPAPVGPTMAIFWPGSIVGREVVDDDLIRAVAEVHILELDVSLRPRRARPELRRLGHFLCLVQELEDALGRGGGLLQDVRDLGELGDRLGEGAHVLDEGLDVADGDDVPMAAR